MSCQDILVWTKMVDWPTVHCHPALLPAPIGWICNCVGPRKSLFFLKKKGAPKGWLSLSQIVGIPLNFSTITCVWWYLLSYIWNVTFQMTYYFRKNKTLFRLVPLLRLARCWRKLLQLEGMPGCCTRKINLLDIMKQNLIYLLNLNLLKGRCWDAVLAHFNPCM